jgi:hypothetical protein
MFSITQFKENVKIVRPNQFFVELYLPQTIAAAVSPEVQNVNNTFRFRCEATEFPGRTVATSDDISFGPTIRQAYDITYNDLNLSIIASEDMNERRVFETWIDNIVTNSGLGVNTGVGQTGVVNFSSIAFGGFVKYYNNYSTGSVVIYQVNDAQTQLAKCTLSGAFPIGIGPMNLSWEENDSYQRFAVTIAYRYHLVDFTQVSLAGRF